MTLYSVQANRGKYQILATYAVGDQAMTHTVTSVQGPDDATAVVSALNTVMHAWPLLVVGAVAAAGAFRYFVTPQTQRQVKTVLGAGLASVGATVMEVVGAPRGRPPAVRFAVAGAAGLVRGCYKSNHRGRSDQANTTSRVVRKAT